MVRPNCRRQGVATMLMATLEAAAWDAGYREIQAETLSTWTAAIAFYRACGYEETRLTSS
jgi:ribosomal protein S18 acetylase RimI-like enzyme